ncbi:MAG: hypothetical protein GEU95_10415 [Rhizobiales bacterium]|nr:hypothetical protein [Hyphomicrobiales bacterium]
MRVIALIIALPLYALGIALLGLGMLVLAIAAILCGGPDDEPLVRDKLAPPDRRLRELAARMMRTSEPPH